MSDSVDTEPIVKPGTDRQPSIVKDDPRDASKDYPKPFSGPPAKITDDENENETSNENATQVTNNTQNNDNNENKSNPYNKRTNMPMQVPSTTASAVPSMINTEGNRSNSSPRLSPQIKYAIDKIENENKNDNGIELQDYSSPNIITSENTLPLSQFQLAVQSQDLNDHQLIARFAITLTYLLLCIYLFHLTFIFEIFFCFFFFLWF